MTEMQKPQQQPRMPMTQPRADDTEAFLDVKNKYFFEKYKKFKVNDIYSHSRKNQATKFFNYTYSQGYCIL